MTVKRTSVIGGGVVAAPLATGVAATDTANLQALFDRGSSSSPVIVELPPGQNYSVNELVARSGVIIYGNWSKLTATAGSVQGIINNRTLQAPVDRFEVRQVEFVGQGQTVGDSTERRGPLYIYNGTRIVVEDCMAHDFSDHGFGVRNAQDVRLLDNTLWNCCNYFLGNALEISSGLALHTAGPISTTRGIIRGNVVLNCHTAPVCVQSTVYQSEMTGTSPANISSVPQVDVLGNTYLEYDVLVVDNPFLEATVENVAAHGFSAIALEIARYGTPGGSSQGVKMGHVIIRGNNCRMVGTPGASSPGTWAISASDNNGSNGPQSTDWDEFHDVLISGNTIESVDGGILCQSSRAIVQGNTMRCNLRGILCAYNNAVGHIPEQIVVDSNIIHLDALLATSGAIMTTGTAHATVQGNRITYFNTPVNGQTPTSNGIYINQSTNTVVVNNVVRGSTKHGVTFLNCTGYHFANNRVTNPSGASTGTYSALYLDTTTGDSVIKGYVVNNILADDRGASKQMGAALGVNGGAARMYADGNRLLGWPSAALACVTGDFYWWGVNDMGGSQGAIWNPSGVTPTGSPMTFTNSPSGTFPTRMNVIVRGGTVSDISIKHGSATGESTGMTAGAFSIGMGDSVVVTYTVAPIIRFVAF